MKSRSYFVSLAPVLVGLLAVGAVSALAKGGPVGDVASLVTGGDEGQGADVSQVVPGQGDRSGQQVVSQEEEGEPGEGAQAVAQVIAGEFGVTKEEVLAFHEQGIGFGALFKLYAIAKAKGISVSDLLATISTDENGEHEVAFGKLINGLTDEEMAALEGGSKNLGELVSSAHKDQNGEGAEASEAETDAGASQGQGHGPPAFARAHGRR